jgi:hypothetical protein
LERCSAASQPVRRDRIWVGWNGIPRTRFYFRNPDPAWFLERTRTARAKNIDIYRNFAGLQDVHEDSVTAGPTGTTLIAATDDPRPKNQRGGFDVRARG